MRINSIYGNFHPKSNRVSFKQIDLSEEYKNDLKEEGVLYDNPEDAPIQTWNIPRSRSRAVKALRDQTIDHYSIKHHNHNNYSFLNHKNWYKDCM